MGRSLCFKLVWGEATKPQDVHLYWNRYGSGTHISRLSKNRCRSQKHGALHVWFYIELIYTKGVKKKRAIKIRNSQCSAKDSGLGLGRTETEMEKLVKEVIFGYLFLFLLFVLRQALPTPHGGRSVILLPWQLKFWDYGQAAPCLAENRFDETKNTNLVVTILRFAKGSMSLWDCAMGIFIIYSYGYMSGQGQDKRQHCVFHGIKIDRSDKLTFQCSKSILIRNSQGMH